MPFKVFTGLPSMAYASMAFTIVAIVFMVLVGIMYLGKRKFRNVENNIFLFMVILTIVLLIWEILYVISIDHWYDSLLSVSDYIKKYGTHAFRFFFKMGKYNANGSLNSLYFNNTKVIPSGSLNIICRTYLVLASLWVVSLFGYIWVLALKYRKKEATKKDYKIIFITLLAVFLTGNIISLYPNLVIEYKRFLTGMYVFGGDAVTSLYFIAFILTIVLIIALVKSGKAIPKEQKKPIFFSFFIFISTTIAQLIFDFDINDLTFIFAFIMTTLYLTIESQDYQLVDELKKKKDEAEEADRQKTIFLSNMSHEIRTPLNTILGFSEALLNEQNLTQEMVINDTKLISSASDTLLDLINNILDISRIESGKEKLEEKEYSLQDLIIELNDLMKSQKNDNVLKFNISVDSELPSKYIGDYVKVQKIISAIIKNAKKYTSYGQINLDITGSEEAQKNYQLKFTISNTGHAMKEEDFNKDFNDFVELDKGAQEAIDSEALGLIVAKRYLNMMNGEITFVNETGHGTRYEIIFNQEVSDYTKVSNVYNFKDRISLGKEGMMDCSGKRALVVDDNALNIKLAEKLLQPYNFNVATASSGNEAIEKVKNNKYDIIFLDHMMPELDGVETFKILQNSGYYVPPTIALTANSFAGLKDKYIQDGFTDYLAKPINVKELNRIIHSVFDKK